MIGDKCMNRGELMYRMSGNNGQQIPVQALASEVYVSFGTWNTALRLMKVGGKEGSEVEGEASYPLYASGVRIIEP
jgi:hypothetical protein